MFTNVYGQAEDLSIVAPTDQATILAYDQEAKLLTWERGNGSRVLVMVRRGRSLNKMPRNTLTYRPEDFVGNQKVVYRGKGTEVSLTDLPPGLYYAQAWEFNGPASSEVYLLDVIEAVFEIVPPEETGAFDDSFDDTFE